MLTSTLTNCWWRRIIFVSLICWPAGALAADGHTDLSFGAKGIVYPGFQSFFSSGVGVAFQSDGKLLLAGIDDTVDKNFVARYDLSGQLDSGFGSGGLVYTGFAGSYYGAADIAVQSDGKILLAGTDETADEDFVARFDATGTLDATFGVGGVAHTGFLRTVVGVSIAVRSDGKILLGGVDGAALEGYVARFNSNGVLDGTFGTGGVVRTGVLTLSATPAITPLPNGKVVFAGHDFSGFKNFVAQFDTAGALDSSFGTAGIAYPGLLSSENSHVGVGAQSDGKVIAVGYDFVANQVYMARFDTTGSLDNIFGTSGILHLGFSAAEEIGVGIRVQSDDKILLGAFHEVTNDNVLLRFDAAGSPDTGFGPLGNGQSFTYFFNTGSEGFDIAVADDGTIALAGHDNWEYVDFAARFDASGYITRGYGNGGVAFGSVTGSDLSGVGTAVQSDGKVIVAGVDVGIYECAVMRFDTTGHADAGFGTGGVAHTGFFSSNDNDVDVALQFDGNIVLAGTDASLNQDFVARFDATGALDATFGTGGVARVGFFTSGDVGVGIQLDGKVVLAGFDGVAQECYVARFDATGVLDATFGTGGVAHVGFLSGFDAGIAVAVKNNGKIVLAGHDFAALEDFVACFDAAGTLDGGFGTGGIARTGLFSSATSDVDVAFQHDGMVLLAGTDGAMSENFVARFDKNGALDGAFNGTGVAHTGVTSSGGFMSGGVAVTPQYDGKIVLGGIDVGRNDAYVTRFTLSGALDATFGLSISGTIHTGQPGGPESGLAVALEADGDIVLAGHLSELPAQNYFVTRLLSSFQCPLRPIITEIVDVPDDQGGWAYLRFLASCYDSVDEDSIPIATYDVHRRVDNLLATEIIEHGTPLADEPWQSGASGDLDTSHKKTGTWVEYDGERYLIEGSDATAPPLGVWSVVASLSAQQQSEYLVQVPTAGDSMATFEYSIFYVSAHTTTPSIYLESDLAMGYSVDNIAPGVPQGFSVAYNTGLGNQLAWDPSSALDFQYFRVYRSEDPNFIPSDDDLVHSTTSNSWTDPEFDGGTVSYKITALDYVGNESAPASAANTSGVDPSEVPVRFALHQNVPNPFNPRTAIQYDVPAHGAVVTIRVYNVSGRSVRTLVNGYVPAGRHSTSWLGRNDAGGDAASGVYFLRLSAPGVQETRKITLLR